MLVNYWRGRNLEIKKEQIEVQKLLYKDTKQDQKDHTNTILERVRENTIGDWKREGREDHNKPPQEP